ncbi:hypothetical protein AVEN_68155-1 [Araneus ventricosus]|uniref:Transposase Tc1-like domain-containing protein n=1 Tax=Araneus ventricosus TaxID=182803 RepID=A0A4Y2MUP0_ARAVE|nr:hypothetical protein AVEN_68155-1 [Araneus ventricosus]
MEMYNITTTTVQPWPGRPQSLVDRYRRVLKKIVLKNPMESAEKMRNKFQEASVSTVSTKTIRREIQTLGFQGRAAAFKPRISVNNTKHPLQWCKTRQNWSLEQWQPAGVVSPKLSRILPKKVSFSL